MPPDVTRLRASCLLHADPGHVGRSGHEAAVRAELRQPDIAHRAAGPHAAAGVDQRKAIAIVLGAGGGRRLLPAGHEGSPCPGCSPTYRLEHRDRGRRRPPVYARLSSSGWRWWNWPTWYDVDDYARARCRLLVRRDVATPSPCVTVCCPTQLRSPRLRLAADEVTQAIGSRSRQRNDPTLAVTADYASSRFDTRSRCRCIRVLGAITGRRSIRYEELGVPGADPRGRARRIYLLAVTGLILRGVGTASRGMGGAACGCCHRDAAWCCWPRRPSCRPMFFVTSGTVACRTPGSTRIAICRPTRRWQPLRDNDGLSKYRPSGPGRERSIRPLAQVVFAAIGRRYGRV